MNTNATDEIQQLAIDTYYTIRQKVTENEQINILHIGNEFSFIAYGMDSTKPNKVWTLNIGTEKTAREFFKHNPPTPGEVENAIMVIEDEVMPVNKLLATKTNLYTINARVDEIAKQTVFVESEQGILLSRSDMEHVFNRLAAIISGRPASQDILPTTNTFAATLLILREVMHHLGFVDITILRRD